MFTKKNQRPNRQPTSSRTANSHVLEALEPRLLLSAYHLSFDNEFNAMPAIAQTVGSATPGMLPTEYWNNHYLSNNGEQEYYCYPGIDTGYNPFSVSNGVLSITANPTPQGMDADGQPYVSGMLSTAAGANYSVDIQSSTPFSQQYGYFEMRAKMPNGKGLWPAFWLMPANGSSSAEYDIFEVLGNDTSSIYQSAHWSNYAGNSTYNYQNQIDSADGFHTYGFEWDADNIRWYVDDTLTHTMANHSNTPMYMIMNLAVGGYWPGNPDGTTPWPSSMQIDYVRVYSNDPNVPAVQPQSGYDGSLPVAIDALAAPANFAAATPNPGQINLTWNPVAGAASYNLYRAATSGGEGSTPYQSGLTTTSFNDTGLLGGTTYYYTIQAVNVAGQSPQSAELHATVNAASDIVVVDNPSATLVGAWTVNSSTPGYEGSNYLHDANTGKGAKSATYTSYGLDGVYEVYAKWTTNPNRASNVPIDVLSTAGTDTVTVNQQQNGGVWNLLGTYTFNGSGSVVIRNDGTNGYVIADAVEFVKISDTTDITIDNSAATVVGSWTSGTSTPGFEGSDYLHDGNTGKGSKSVTYSLSNAAGLYEVYAKWTTNPNRASNVPIDVVSAAGTDTVTVNQQQNGGVWNLLGTYTFDGSGSVVIRNGGTSGYVIADAVRFVQISPAGYLDFDNYTITPYDSSQGDGGTVTTLDNGHTLQIAGNGWDKININYTVTANTVLEFDFKNTVAGEVQAIGFDTNNSQTGVDQFQLFGTQTYGIQTYRTYSGNGWTHYTINVGQSYTGLMNYLTFINDDDAANLAVSLFSNIRIYEA